MWGCHLCGELNKLEKKYIPTRHYSGPSKKDKYATPLDKAIREDIRLKHRMWARYMRKRDEESHLAYTKQRNKVRKLTRQAKKEREIKIAQEVKSIPKKYWSYVAARTKTGLGISELEIANTTDGQGKPTRTKSDKEKADVLIIRHFQRSFHKGR